MNWTKFLTYEVGQQKAFESLCNQIFEVWLKDVFGTKISYHTTVRGDGGDGGVESFAELVSGEIVGLQAKWFPERLEGTQITQIEKSIKMAMSVRPLTSHYIVTLPKDLTSKKQTRGGKITDNTEEQRWLDLCSKMAKDFPNLKLELWNDHKISSLLQLPDLEGCHKYWFEKECIPFILLESQFELAKSSWLKPRYTPDLHSVGNIEKSAAYIIRPPKICRKIHDRFLGIENAAKELLSELYHLEKIINSKLEDPGKSLIRFLKRTCHYIESNIERISHGLDIDEYSEIDTTDYADIHKQLSKIETNIKFSHVAEEIQKKAQILYRLYPEDFIKDTVKKWNSRERLFLGGPTTGKTHALAHMTETLLKNEYPCLLVQAKSIKDSSSWKTILQQAIDLGSDWTGEQIFSALESRANTREIQQKYIKEGTIQTCSSFLISVDGIDESKDWESWRNRILEANQLSLKYKRLRFVFTSRPYILTEDFNNSYEGILVDVPRAGDVPVEKLFDNYISTYNINVSQAAWVKASIRSPLALRLFCDEYKGQTLKADTKVITTIGSLLSKRVGIIESELGKIITPHTITPGGMLKAFVDLANFFQSNFEIDHETLNNVLTKSLGLSESLVNSSIEIIMNHGLLFSYPKGYKSPIEPGTIFYQPTSQPIIEFFRASDLVNKVIINSNYSLPNHLISEHGILEIAASMLFIDHGKMIGEEGLWTESLSENVLLELRCWTLTTIPPDMSKKYIDWVKNQLVESMPKCRAIQRHLTYPLSRVPGHPLGPILLHSVLNSYLNPATRDLVWSGLDYCTPSCGGKWEGHGENPIKQEHACRLIEGDHYNGLPLLHAWNLSSVDNEVVDRSARQLVNWGSKDSDEFIKLLEHLFPTNDPQVAEMLMACGYGVVSLLDSRNSEQLKRMALWVLENIFTSENLAIHRNAVIRGAGRGIVERAFHFKLINKEEVAAARPPFKVAFNLLPISSDAAQAGESYRPIWHDLAWYVVKKAYQPFFNEYHEPREEQDRDPLFWEKEEHLNFILQNKLEKLSDTTKLSIEKVLEKRKTEAQKWKETRIIFSEKEASEMLELLAEAKREKKKAGGSETVAEEVVLPNYYQDSAKVIDAYSAQIGSTLGPHQLILGLIYQYLRDLGWNEEEFYGSPNGGNEGEVLGADLAITRQHFMSSHGSRSKIMSFGEKYIWTAVNFLLGYFSDHIQVNERDTTPAWVSDYSQIILIPNPAQTFLIDNHDEISQKWILPIEFSPNEPEIGNDIIKDLDSWIRGAKVPNFSAYISPTTELTRHLCSRKLQLIHSFTSLRDVTELGDSLLWLNCLLLSPNGFELLKRDAKASSPFLEKLIQEQNSGFSTGVDGDSYISPRDVVWQDWKRELFPTNSLVTISNGELSEIDLHLTICEVHSSSVADREKSFEFPSKLVRNGMKIVDGDGFKFFDENGELSALSISIGQSFRDTQDNVYVDRKKFLEFCDERDLIPVWFLRFDRRQSTKAFQAFDKRLLEISYRFIYYLHDSQFKCIELNPILSE